MVNNPSQRLSPEKLLEQADLEERRKRRGRLKVFLGYAGGVGKSFQMFDEGRRRRDRGEDVVVCAMQSQYPPEVQTILRSLEIIPTLKVGDAEAIDVAGVMRRHPQLVLVDGLAYENPPGSSHEHRWEDVEDLLEAGISVITTINLQYLEKLRDEVAQITGKRASCSIPVGYLDNNADEIVIVDAPAAESLSHGSGPGGDSATRDSASHKLSRLRELALLVTAQVVDHQLECYLRSHGMDQPFGVQERILVCVTPRSNAAAMLESGRRNADRFHGELHAIYVTQPGLSQSDRAAIRNHLSYARQLGAHTETLSGLKPVEAILNLAREIGITQIFIGQTKREGAWRRLWTNMALRLIRSAEGIDVIVFPN